LKRRVLSLCLALALLLALLPAGVSAAYGARPIYIGDAAADYMAEQVLKQIPTAGKTGTQKIQAVYDWIQKNCKRSGDDSKTYFDSASLSAKAEAFGKQMTADYNANKIVIRREFSSDVTDDTYGSLASYDSNAYIASFASNLMMTRVGNCAHFSALLALLLGHLGYDCRLIAGDFINNDGSQVMHKWNYLLYGGKYYWMDVRMDNASYARTGSLSHYYFMKTDTAAWARQHRWVHAYTYQLNASVSQLAAMYGAANPIPPAETQWGYCSSWAESYVNQAGADGLIPSCLSGQDQRDGITRQEFAAVAVALYKKLSGAVPDPDNTDPFTDCSDADVLRAYALGVVNGTGEGRFSPNGALTREQAVSMLGRVCELVQTGAVADGSKLDQTSAKTFADGAQISDYARSYIGYFTGRGVIDGVGSNLFAPKRAMTREQAIKVAVAAEQSLASA